MKFIMLNGASCVGKSTIIKKLLSQKEKYFKVSYDALKWSFSKYQPDTHFDDIRTLVRAVAKSVCEMQYNIVCDSALHRETRDRLFEIPRTYGYEIIEINLEADYGVLVERFERRVGDTLLDKDRPISNTSVERFKELFDIYQNEKNPFAITFKTDEQSIEEITESILKMM